MNTRNRFEAVCVLAFGAVVMIGAGKVSASPTIMSTQQADSTPEGFPPGESPLDARPCLNECDRLLGVCRERCRDQHKGEECRLQCSSEHSTCTASCK